KGACSVDARPYQDHRYEGNPADVLYVLTFEPLARAASSAAGRLRRSGCLRLQARLALAHQSAPTARAKAPEETMNDHSFVRLNPSLRAALIAGLFLSCSTVLANGT